MGVRLSGPPLRRVSTVSSSELPSEGALTEAMQVPPNGFPLVFRSDRSITGGYPVIASVRRGSLAALGRARPGTWARFHTSF
ncbi:hypothetical protein [Amycolatopsis benzoatilytica]|uniref:hypothetical protein n=1 Tax=Amycolatopsis benzoatilytica TaxID=346045 RepID=UPI0003A19C8D|nr:hypothetical protein [Amycolatopsis benzoatilytica]